jgi:hypothetical protein
MNKQQIFIIILFLSFLHLNGQKVRYNTSFRNYRVSLGAGLGYSPIMLLNAAPFNYKPWEAAKPSLKLELTPTPKFSFNFGIQREHYNYRITPSIEYTLLGRGYTDYKDVDLGVKFTQIAYTFDMRNYTTYSGYLAPFGRYVMWGFSINKGRYQTDAFSFNYEDELNGQVTVNVPNDKFKTSSDLGIRFGMGKKRYNGKKLKTFFEYQLILDAKVGDFGSGLEQSYLSSYGGSKRVAYETGMRISQSNSIFQFNIIYGFSF